MHKSIGPEDYREFQVFLERSCGIVLGDNKHYLVTSRLSRLLDEFRLPSLGDLVRGLRSDVGSRLRERVVEAMTTNETLWFRDGFPFEILKQLILVEFSQRATGPIRIWSAACSSGQEPYSISMSVQEYLANRPGGLRGEVQITGTDISPAMLAEARAARYDAAAMARGLSPERRQRFFVPHGDQWEVRPEIRARVAFRDINLLQSYALLGRFDVIFCRNVLIYFSPQSKQDILTRMAQALNPGGYLFLGASESVASHSAAFEMIRASAGLVYRRR